MGVNGEVKDVLVVNYLKDVVFDILEGWYGNEEDEKKIKVKIDWFDVLDRFEGNVEVMMKEISELGLFEGFVISSFIGDELVFKGVIGENDVWEVCF